MAFMGVKQVLFVLLAIGFAIGYIWFVFGIDTPKFKRVPIKERFRERVVYINEKIVYTTDTTLAAEPFIRDCAIREGKFNQCGTICAPGAEVCATVCAYTCESSRIESKKPVRFF